jgi:hypothetical protein
MLFLDILGNSSQSFYEFLMTCLLEIIIDLRMLLTCLLFDAKLMATKAKMASFYTSLIDSAYKEQERFVDCWGCVVARQRSFFLLLL